MKTTRLRNRRMILPLAVFLTVSLTLGMAACSGPGVQVEAADLMSGISGSPVSGKTADDKFISSTANFSIELFKKTVTENENSLVSPLSVLLALSMTANGAAGQTLEQMETLLGGEIPLDDLNEYLYNYIKNLPSKKDSKLNIANSIWFRDEESRLTVEKDFLQKNADYYDAAAYKSAFDETTLKDINNWVKAKTDGMIEKILDEIREDAVMYLINAIVFDARWKTVYDKNDIVAGEFTAIDGSRQSVEFMNSEENIYLDDGMAVGFMKPYVDDNYSFMTLLPNPDVAIGDYIASMTGEGLKNIVKNAKETLVTATLPKFAYDYTVRMNDALKSLGMPDAFDADLADFSRLGKSTRGNILIGEVLHKTFISVDELGTKAGAVTKVEMVDESMPETKIVRLDRPFLYAVIDNATGLPVFIGTVMSFE